MIRRVAPVTVASAAADGAGLDLVHRSGGEVVDGHGAAAGVEAAVLPWTQGAAGTDYGETQLVAFGVFDRADAGDELAAVAVDDFAD